MVEDEGDGFLGRWSRRKRGESAPDEPETETVAVLTEPDPGPEEDPDAGDPEVIAKLPDIDSLTEESDFTVFLKEGVPEALRRRALRRLWRTNPVFAVLDGLNDYDEDYSAGGIIAENIKTIYKVGKGYLDDDDETKDQAGDEVAEDAEAGAEAEETGGPESESESEPESEALISGDPLESTKVSQTGPGAGSEPPAAGELEAKSARPVRGTALARRWGGSPDQG